MTYDRKDADCGGERSPRRPANGEWHPSPDGGTPSSGRGTSVAEAACRRRLNPSSIAIVGASDNPNKIGGRPLLYLSRFGYEGRVYPINPNRAEGAGARDVSRHRFAARSAGPDDRRDARAAGRCRPSTTAPPAASARRSSWRRGIGETADASAIAAQHAMVAARQSCGHAAHRSQFTGAGQLRHRRRRQFLDDVPRGRTGWMARWASSARAA